MSDVERRSGVQGRREDDRHRIDTQVSFLRTALASAVTAVVMLIGSWATHSVSQEQLNVALANEDKVFSERFDNLRGSQNSMQVDVKHIMEMIDDLQVTLQVSPKRIPTQ
jgi:hypothetical protein